MRIRTPNMWNTASKRYAGDNQFPSIDTDIPPLSSGPPATSHSRNSKCLQRIENRRFIGQPTASAGTITALIKTRLGGDFDRLIPREGDDQ